VYWTHFRTAQCHVSLTEFLLQQLISPRLVHKLPTVFGTRIFITQFTRARYFSLSARRIQSTPFSPVSLRLILISSSLIYPSVFQGVSLQVSLPKPRMTFTLSFIKLIHVQHIMKCFFFFPSSAGSVFLVAVGFPYII
jgi:hypothetical protein